MTGLFMLPAEVTVTVTREEQHQQALARYPVAAGVARQVVAELTWCTIETGKYRGERAVEVRLDGMRVGELTYAMSERYQDLLTEITARGHQPGCDALVYIGKRGIEVSLRMPKAETRVPIPSAQPVVPAPARTHQKKPRNKKRPVWIAAVVAGFLFLVGLINSTDEKPTSGSTAPIADVAPVPPPTTATTTTTTATTSSSVPAPPPPPPPSPATPTTKKSTTTKQAPPPPPPATDEPAQNCHPNYDPCVPVAKDVDCKGGSGNGPEYVKGPIRVIGKDVYGLDDNNNGIGCE
ncbi:hypothetical protein DMH04_31165 [Kibdelosporangium aridum]|uniref:Excalibur calcium-binding domain-containing protein n=1 Tax=Kibdelosporangium aridum TaxID=2030 RepID=A0A428Z2F0_KIBAR|nr:hypothetical protein [Kibdelosporangium aridum]RSM79449.1 hypothetical protein DMH04_31165 [Kibdelosporangium aridum]